MRFCFIFILLLSFNLFGQNPTTAPAIKWYSFEEAIELNKKNPKKILIDMYTSWCGWCKRMDATTFGNPNIAAYISQNFYAVKFDAERKDTVEYNGKKYVCDSGGARMPHQLAVELLQGKMSYPTIVYMDENSKLLSPVPGYMTPDQIEPVLIFFSQDVYKICTYEAFTKNFNSTFKDTSGFVNRVKWYTLPEAIENNKTKPRKIFIDLYSDWNPLCRIMEKTTFNQQQIADYLNAHFYPVRFNAMSKDTLKVLNQTFINEQKEHPYHQFAVTLLQGKMSFPVAVYMGETNQLLTSVPGYMTPEVLEPILMFFSEDIYKTKSFEDFRKDFKSNIK